MDTGEIVRRLARPATAGRRRGAWLRRLPLLLALGTGGVDGAREARGDGPEDGKAAGVEAADLPPLPPPVGARPSPATAPRARAPNRPDEPTGTGRRRLDERQGMGPGP